jgi:lysophospholipase L1-like esterase
MNLKSKSFTPDFWSKRMALVSLLTLLSWAIPPKKITVYLIGDSTMATKGMHVYPETGWGTPFAIFFDSTVVVDNRAKNGRSTKTFISENLWKPIADNLQEGDYVFIQFGHNDEAKEKVDRYTTPDEYKTNLNRYISETKSKKAIPVLLTPVTRRRFDDQGKIMETHEVYSKLVREVAVQTGVAFIDMDEKSRELLQQFGPDHSKLLFLQMEPGEHPNYPEGKNDNTHFNELGARKMAQIALSEIKALKLELADRIVKRKAK